MYALVGLAGLLSHTFNNWVKRMLNIVMLFFIFHQLIDLVNIRGM